MPASRTDTARYRKIAVRIHKDKNFRELSNPQPCGKYLWFYLLTNGNTTNIPGLYHAYEETLARDLEWPLGAFRDCFAEIAVRRMLTVDWQHGLVFIPKAVHYDPPQSPNVVKSWGRPWSELPECTLKDKAYQYLKAFTEGLSKAFGEAFVKACGKPSHKSTAHPSPKPFDNPDPDPDPEQDPDPEPESAQITQARASSAAPLLPSTGHESAKKLGRLGSKWMELGILSIDSTSLAQARALIETYAADSGRPLETVEDQALAAFEAHVGKWSFPQPLTPQLFVRKWEEIQAEMASKVAPSKRVGQAPIAQLDYDDLGEEHVRRR